jgi:cbb3-type cytochrome oxidase cytochrome c subunit
VVVVRHILALGVGCLLVLALSASPHTAPGASTPAVSASSFQQEDPAKVTVYVTRTGTKYHRDGCRYLSKSKIPMSLKEAAERYGPCSVCKPPRLQAGRGRTRDDT